VEWVGLGVWFAALLSFFPSWDALTWDALTGFVAGCLVLGCGLFRWMHGGKGVLLLLVIECHMQLLVVDYVRGDCLTRRMASM
jgi:hypothetical protein